jgi:uncharacterized membrane protein
LLGFGLGGFFDGIVLHQLLQWHHMVSSAYPTETVSGLRVNTLGDGLFHAFTYVVTIAGVFLLWSAARQRHTRWPTAPFIGLLLIGWGAFNLVEGVIDHLMLGIHHVNETVSREQWIWWDLAFLVWGVAMVIIGWWLLRTNRVEHEQGGNGPASDPGSPPRKDLEGSQSLVKPRSSRPGIAP